MRIVFFLLVVRIVFAQTDVYTEGTWAGRDAWQKPKELIRLLNVKEGGAVADIGCHEGYMTVKLAQAVGSSGKIYGVDVDQYKLDRLKQHLASRGLANVELIKGDYDDPKLPKNALDGVLVVDAYHEMDAYESILQHIRVSLKAGGRLVICEPIDDRRKNLSRKEQERKHEIGMNYVQQDLLAAGFNVIYAKEDFVDRVAIKGDRMWVVVAGK